MQFWHAFSNFSLRVRKDLLISIFETNFPQLCSAHWERAFDRETLFIGQQFLILIRLFHNFPAKETWKSSYFAAWTQCFSHYESFMYSCGIPWPLKFAQVFGRLSVLSNTLFWLRSVNWLIDFLRNSLDNLASFKSFDDSCCSAFSSFLHGLLRFARVLERLNDDALFNHTLKFGWGVRPFSGDFWAEETCFFSGVYCFVLVISFTAFGQKKHLMGFVMSSLRVLFSLRMSFCFSSKFITKRKSFSQ